MKGFTLVEVLVAMALVASAAVGLAALFGVATATTQTARIDSVETMVAETKMAELRGLPWTYDAAGSGVVVSDPALSASPASALTTNTAGYVEYVDASGSLVGAGTAAPATSVYLRRWSVTPLPADPTNGVVLQVMAAAVTRPQSRDVHLVSILARTAQ